jgi:hypothetical protein
VFRLAQFELADPTFRKSAPFYFAPPIFFRNNTCRSVWKQRLLSPFYSALRQNPVRRSSGSYSQKSLSFLCSIICAHKSCVCHSYKNNRGVPKLFPLWNSLNPPVRAQWIHQPRPIFTSLLPYLVTSGPPRIDLTPQEWNDCSVHPEQICGSEAFRGPVNATRPACIRVLHRPGDIRHWGNGIAPQLPAVRAVQERDVS